MLRTPSRPKLLVLARHGESVTNALKKGPFCPTKKVAKIFSRLPSHAVPLTEKGRRQANRLGTKLAKEFGTFDVVIYSSYLRTQQTAERAVRRLKTPPSIMVADFRLRERESGYGYSMTKKKFLRRFPDMKKYWKHAGWFYSVPPGGESGAQVLQRAIPVIKEISEQWAGKRVLIVGHGKLFQILQAYLEQVSLAGPKCPIRHLDNCQYVTYRF